MIGGQTLRKANDLLGLPVIEVQTGKQLGTAKDIVFDPNWCARGITLETKHWFSSSQFIDWENILSFGEDAITIATEDLIKGINEAADANYLLNGEHKVKGAKIFTVNGQQLGTVEDVYFSKDMGKRIMGYELSDGFLADVTEGRKWLPIPDHATMGIDVILVPVKCSEEVQVIAENIRPKVQITIEE
jgi:uncharacterized protein YrrD